MNHISSQKSTIGRARIGRALAGFLATVAPGLAAAHALDRFTRPRRRLETRTPTVDGQPLHAWTLRLPDGKALALWDGGEGPTVLLVHGWNGDAAQLGPLASSLLRAGFHVVLVDLPAHGASSGERATIIDFADAVRRVAERVGPLYALVAHSLGATAGTLALAGGLKVERAVLLAPAADVPTFAGAVARALGLTPAAEREYFARMAARIGPLDALDLRRRAGALAATRALVLHDPADREVPYEHGASIARAWPGARLETLSGANHNGLLTDGRTLRLVQDFLAAPRIAALPRSA